MLNVILLLAPTAAAVLLLALAAAAATRVRGERMLLSVQDNTCLKFSSTRAVP